MVECFVDKVADKLIQYNYIETAQRDSYVYAMLMSFETWILLSIIMLISIWFQKTIPTIFFLIFLFAIKKRSGGFHAENYRTCFFLTILIYVCFVIFLLPYMVDRMEITYIMLSISIFILETIGAVNHPNVDWDTAEYVASKCASRMVVVIESLIIGILGYLDASSEVIVFMAFAVILSAFLLLLAKIIKQEVYNEKRSS